MKDYFFILGIIVGFLFGIVFEKQFRQREKLEAIQTSQQNTVHIIETSKNIKDKVEHAKDKNCVDIFSIDISSCVQ